MTDHNRFHCCATCQHFAVIRKPGETSYRCNRLTYATRPEWQFNCWTPKEQVIRLMDKEKGQRG